MSSKVHLVSFPVRGVYSKTKDFECDPYNYSLDLRSTLEPAHFYPPFPPRF